MHNKVRVLRYIRDHGPVPDPADMVTHLDGLGLHSAVHLVWSCQKLGLLTFKQTKSGNLTVPTKLTITEKGRKWLAKRR